MRSRKAPGARTPIRGIAVLAAAALAIAAPALAQDDAQVELKVGDAAPDFTLPASDGKSYTLSDFKGKQPVVVAFFPKAFTGGWTAQCKSLRDSAGDIKSYDVAYFMASMDTVDENTKFAAEHGGGFPILCDPEKKTLAAYGVLHERGFANRWTFYIDKEGIIKKIDKSVKFGSAGADMVTAMGELDFPKAD